MKARRSILLILLAFFCISINGCGSDSNEPQVVKVAQKDAGTTVVLHKNQALTVSLPGNGTTGYVWDVLPGAESVITQQGSTQFVADSNAVGAGGTYTFAFTPVALGTTRLIFIYHRPSDTVAPEPGFSVTVAVVD
jgi:inhibitor of cysteine peptidase